nr:efflux RND transporter periplasmic adaptor subunit [Neorhizobium lilium]
MLAICLAAFAYAGWQYRDRIPYLSEIAPKTAANDQLPQGQQDQGQQDQGRRRGNGPPPVVKTVAASRAVLPMDATATGSADADENTTIAAQEAGLIVSIAAHDGDVVKAGDLIAKLDDRTAKATVDKDKALLARDQATLAQAETALTRAQTLVERNAGTQQAADEARASRDTAAATLLSDRAAIAADEITVEHTDIRAPFDGRLGDISISIGAYLSAGATVVTIAKYDPIFVNFHLPEAYLDDLREGFGGDTIAVDAIPQSSAKAPVKGKLTFFNNTVDAASGTILAKARFENASGALWPGQSVNVTVHFQSDKKDIVIPTVAINPGVDQPFVYTVGDDKKVHMTKIEVSRSNGDQSAVTKGLDEGTHVVVEGQVQLVDGAVVNEQFGDDPKGKKAAAPAAGISKADGSVEVGEAK